MTWPDLLDAHWAEFRWVLYAVSAGIIIKVIADIIEAIGKLWKD